MIREFFSIRNKSFKLTSLVVVLVLGTFFLIRKVDRVKEKVNNYVKSNLLHLKNYKSIGIIRRNDDSSLSIIKSTISKDKLKFDPKSLKLIDYKFRLNDTLYIVHVILNDQDSIIAMDKPLKK